MHEGRNVRDVNRTSGGQALESRVSSKDSCPVWGGAVGKGLVQASTSLAAYSTLRPRRCRSSRRSHARPRGAGKPHTGRRAPGGRQESGKVCVMQRADPRDCASTGERCAGKPARTVRRGADGTGPCLRYLAGGLPYFNYPLRFLPRRSLSRRDDSRDAGRPERGWRRLVPRLAPLAPAALLPRGSPARCLDAAGPD